MENEGKQMETILESTQWETIRVTVFLLFNWTEHQSTKVSFLSSLDELPLHSLYLIQIDVSSAPMASDLVLHSQSSPLTVLSSHNVMF